MERPILALPSLQPKTAFSRFRPFIALNLKAAFGSN